MSVRGILCDLDGVVYRAHEPCPGAVEGLTAARQAGVAVLFMTNNASRPPQVVADQLTELGLPTPVEQVLTASQVAAQVVRDHHPELVGLAEARVLAVGGPGVTLALREVGVRAVAAEELLDRAPEEREVDVVVQGYGAEVGVRDLTEAAYAVASGAEWIATNDDATLPTERGLAPGNGALLAAVRHATGCRPNVVGKPHAQAYDVGLRQLGLPLEECLMLGDRLDTDIAGARSVGLRSALVLTGVSTRAEAEDAPERLRPDHVAQTIPDLAHLWSGS